MAARPCRTPRHPECRPSPALPPNPDRRRPLPARPKAPPLLAWAQRILRFGVGSSTLNEVRHDARAPPHTLSYPQWLPRLDGPADRGCRGVLPRARPPTALKKQLWKILPPCVARRAGLSLLPCSDPQVGLWSRRFSEMAFRLLHGCP